MTDLKLEVGEGILLQTNDAGLYDGNNEIDIYELYLTNKNIIYVHEKSTGFFKSETVVDKIPLSSIAVINGVVQVEQVDDDDYGKALQFIYTNGRRELLELNVSPKKQYPVWKSTISDAVIRLTAAPAPQVITEPTFSTEPAVPVEPVVPVVKEEKGGRAFAGATLFAGFKGVVDAAKQTFAEVSQTVTEKVAQPVEHTQKVVEAEPIQKEQTANNVNENKESKIMFCSNCGTKLNEGAKFCHGCGSAVGTVTPPAPPVVEQPVQPKVQERQQEYVGKILKCPHCGGVITERDVICPDCGMEITGRAAISSVQAFKEQLMEIESHRKKAFGGMFSVYSSVDPADKQKLSLIRNFPIPNTIDDILEFVMLAIANIDVSLSKKSWANSSQSMEIFAMEMPKVISNAWVSKMQQAYQKAEILFPNDPTFKGIQKLYFDKMKELKIKV